MAHPAAESYHASHYTLPRKRRVAGSMLKLLFNLTETVGKYLKATIVAVLKLADWEILFSEKTMKRQFLRH